MASTTLDGSAAHGASGSSSDAVLFVGEMLRPRLLATETYRDVISTQFPELAGIVPDVGRFDPCPWGLGVEIRGDKSPHWTGRANSPQTFGHFGGSGTMMWVDPSIECRRRRPHRSTVRRVARRRALAVAAVLRCRRSREADGGVTFQAGDRVRWETTGDDGLPLIRYGFVGYYDGNGHVTVMLDGDLTGDTVVDLSQLAAVSITSVELCLSGADLLDDPSLRQGLVNLWSAEVDEAGLEIRALERLGNGVKESDDGFALAQLWAGSAAVRAARQPRRHRRDGRRQSRRPALLAG